MKDDSTIRVMWLLNHTTLRNFEVQQLRKCGVESIYVPKSFPYDEGNLSASITYDLDNTLNLPVHELAILNEQNWYGEPTLEAWTIANRYFDIAFVGFFPRQVLAVTRSFCGAVIMRAFGLGGEETYSKLIRSMGGEALSAKIHRCGKRFWFGMGYDHLGIVEEPFISDRAVYLPVGLNNVTIQDQWEGNARCIFFVCPRIGSSPYFKKIYQEFISNFEGIDYLVGGAQPIAVDDPNVIGFVSGEQHAYNMKQSRVMFYHSREASHIHSHPFEAVRTGLPLVFMAGGMLDRMGGKSLPGRCKSVKEARQKIERILGDDWKLIENIRASQSVLLEVMRPEQCEPLWREGFLRIVSELNCLRNEHAKRPQRVQRKRIAVILPISYRGGSLRGAISIAQALYVGSRQFEGEAADIVFLHIDDPQVYSKEIFDDLQDKIPLRPFKWKTLSKSEARRAMRYAGFQDWEPVYQSYMVPDDGIMQLQDCDLWMIVSDRLDLPVLPIKPLVIMVYDYLQRYEDVLAKNIDQGYLDAARAAERILVTTNFTAQDAMQYAGIAPARIRKVPMLAPDFPIIRNTMVQSLQKTGYFIWTTNASAHKNHVTAAKALRVYYEELEGQLNCVVTGVNTEKLLSSELPHLKSMAEVISGNRTLLERVKCKGELPEAIYRRELTGALFLWHPARIDNGSFSVIEAACLGVPSLSCDYPAMREIDKQYLLNLAWMEADDPVAMARALKDMELSCFERRKMLPSSKQLAMQKLECLAGEYWEAVRLCL